MPAAELSRLRAQLPRLAVLFDRPQEFRRALIDLYETYANPTFRSARALIPSYHIPQLVIRQMELMLGSQARALPEAALAVVDVLWRETYLEPRVLGAFLLGQIPLSQAEGILERLRRWAVPAEDGQMLGLLFIQGTARLRAEGADALIDLYSEWLLDASHAQRLIGLKALNSLAEDPAYENLPPLYDLLVPLLRSAPLPLFNDLGVLLATLARRAPVETAFFFRQVAASPIGKDTPRLIRRILPLLSESQQESVKSALKNRV